MYIASFFLCMCSSVGIDPSEEDLLEELFDRMYANFVEEVDAVDNGVSAFDGTPRYSNRRKELEALYALMKIR